METYVGKNGTIYFKGAIEYCKTPETCLQPNQISQGLYRCSPMAKKLLAYVISDLMVIKWDTRKYESYEAIFKSSEFIKTVGLQRTGTKQKELIKQALVELQRSYIAIDTGEKFETFSWVTHSTYAEKERKIAIEINHHLGQALMEFKKGFTAIQLLELGKLQSFYAMRYYELALSFSGFEGKNGNKPTEWFFSYSVDDLRQLFQIKDDEYSGRMTNFVTKVVKNPLEELNEKTNILVEFEKIKNGKTIVGFRFHCKRKVKKLKIEKTDSFEIKQEKAEINLEEMELEEYKSKYPEEFASCLEEVEKEPVLFPRMKIANEFEALRRLKDRLNQSE